MSLANLLQRGVNCWCEQEPSLANIAVVTIMEQSLISECRRSEGGREGMNTYMYIRTQEYLHTVEPRLSEHLWAQ